jgi:hypothetical protein
MTTKTTEVIAESTRILNLCKLYFPKLNWDHCNYHPKHIYYVATKISLIVIDDKASATLWWNGKRILDLDIQDDGDYLTPDQALQRIRQECDRMVKWFQS